MPDTRASNAGPGRLGRRELMGAAIGGVVVGAVSPWDRAWPQSTALEVAAMREGMTLVTGAGGNVVLLATDAGGLLIDSGAPEHAATLAGLVDEALGGPVELLVNTHWHLDHTGGNEHFAARGAAIVAHESTRLWMSTPHHVDWQQRRYPARPEAALPTETFYGSDPQPVVRELGGRRVELEYLREAHTDGDVCAFFPDANVLVAGGAVSVGAYPVLDYATGGWIGGLETATRRLLEIADAETLIVPASGPAQRRGHLVAQLDMVATVRGRIEDLMRQGRSAAEMVEAGVTDDFDAVWGDNRERFVTNVYGGLWWQGRLDGSL